MAMNMDVVSQVGLAALAPLQFGYHMAELNAPLPFMGCKGVENPHNPNCIPGLGAGALVSSIYALGGLVGSLIAGPLSDRVGRHPALVSSNGIFVVGSVIVWLSTTSFQLAIGRFLSGVAAGEAIVVAPVFIRQVSPSRFRGLLGSTTQISVNVGILMAQLAGVAWADGPWRHILALGVTFGVFSLVLAAFLLREPPVGPSSDDIPSDISELSPPSPSPTAKPEHTSMERYLTFRRYRSSLIAAVGIMALQQLTGINSIVFYGVAVLQETMPEHSKEVNLGLSIVNLVVTAIGAGLVDRVGHRKLLVGSLGGMGIASAALAFALVRGVAGMAALAACLTVASFALGIGPIPFHLVGELTPSEARAAAQSVATTINFLATFAVGGAFPGAQRILGPSVFYIFSSFSLAGALLVALLL